MPTQEHDSWLSNALGVAVDTLRSAAQTVEDDAVKAKDWVEKKADEVRDDVNKAEDWAKGEVKKGADWVKKEASNVVGEVKKVADAAKMKALGDQSGKPIPRPMEGDCKPEHGYVPGPKNHLLCATHGHVIDTDAGTIIAASVAAYIEAGLGKIVAAVEGGAKKALGSPQPSGDPTPSGSKVGGFDPQGTLEFPLEVKGPKTTGIVKVNKVYFKPSVKISVSGAPRGDVNVGPTGGGKSSDGKGSGQVGVTAEAKQTAQTALTKKFDETVNSLVKSVTGRDDAVKTELFTKAKAEAKGGSKEASVKIGYDFGIDATVFGMGKGTVTVKFTLAGLKYDATKIAKKENPVSATVLAADVSDKLAIKWPKAFQLGATTYDIEGSVEWGAEFEPNWLEIAKDAAGDVAESGVSAAIMTAIDAALVAGPPLLAGIVIAQGIYMAGEKGELDAVILEGATDARQAAFDYSITMVGSEGSGPGPRAKAAVAAAEKQLAESAAKANVSLDEMMTELRQMAPHPDYPRIYAQARQQTRAAYDGEVRKVIHAWREEHYVLAAWTTEADDYAAAERKVALVFET